MKTVAFIPARGGSKGIKSKNILPVLGKPLIYWTISACVGSKLIEKIFISTDSQEIRDVVEGFKFENVEVISRSAETATDNATSEESLIEFCQKFEFQKVVFLQATSPLTTSEDLDGAIQKFEKEQADSLISAIHNHQFLWGLDGKPINYNPQKRPRRQDWDGYMIENGAFYISKRENILKSNCRISGKTIFWEMDSKSFFEIDELQDLKIVEKLF